MFRVVCNAKHAHYFLSLGNTAGKHPNGSMKFLKKVKIWETKI